MKAFIIFLFLSISHWGTAQFTYFNQVFGEVSENSEVFTNVEVIGDEIFIFGIESTSDNLFWYAQKYNLDGELLIEKIYDFPEELLYTGQTTSFKKLNDESGFFFAQKKVDSVSIKSFAMMFDLALDTLWSREYEFSPTDSGFDTFVEVEDGFVLSGNYEDSLIQFGGGTYIQKIDFEGITQWAEVLHTHESEFYSHRNKSIIQFDQQYILGGEKNASSGSNTDNTGLITLVENNGEIITEIPNLENGLSSSRFYVLELSNGEVLCSHVVFYEEAPGGLFFMKTKLYKFDVENLSLFWEQEYLFDEHIMGGCLFPRETADHGIILMGGRSGEDLAYYSSLLKLDSLGNQEWYKEYFFEDCDECLNLAWDFEITSDGGYILVGEFYNWDNLPDKKSWMLKLDACGDVEWEGCEYVGVSAVNRPRSFTIFPNPVNEWLSIEGNVSRNSEIIIYDVSGQLIHQEILKTGNKIDVSFLPSGLYLLSIIEENGSVYTEKLIIN